MSFTIGFFMNAVNAGIIYVGAILYNDGMISIGEITAFLLYMIMLIINFVTLGFVFANLFKLMGASEKII